MDAVAVGAFITVGLALVIIGYLFYKGYQLMNKDPGSK